MLCDARLFRSIAAMTSIQNWPHLATPGVIRTRSKALAKTHREMMSDLIDVRIANGMTQRDVADVMGLTQQRISALEGYDSNPRLETVRRYANAVGAMIDVSVERDDTEAGSERSLFRGTSLSFHVPTHEAAARMPRRVRQDENWSHERHYATESVRADFALGA